MTAEQEDLFRKYYLSVETRLSSFIMLVLMIPLLAFIYNDYEFLGLGQVFYWVVGFRVLLFLATIGIIFFLRGNKDYHVHDRVITAWSAVALAAMLLLSFSRPGNYIGHAVLDVVIIMIIFLAMPNRIINRTLLCLVFTAAEIIVMLFLREQYEIVVLFTIIFAFLVADIAGFAGSWQLDYLRRREFLSKIEIARVSDELKYLSETDDLTGIYNTRAFHSIGADELARFRRYGRVLSLIMLDMDHFKLVNDSYGHMMGDKVLKEAARALASELRQVDIVGRLGGEEFGILLPETASDDARMVAERLKDAVRRLSITTEGGQRISVTISLGVAEALNEDNNLDSLIARADRALYKAKENGRNRVEVFSSA